MESDYLLTLGAISPASMSNELPSGWTVNSELSAAWTRRKPYSSIPMMVTCCELPPGPVTITSAPLSNKDFIYLTQTSLCCSKSKWRSDIIGWRKYLKPAHLLKQICYIFIIAYLICVARKWNILALNARKETTLRE